MFTAVHALFQMFRCDAAAALVRLLPAAQSAAQLQMCSALASERALRRATVFRYRRRITGGQGNMRGSRRQVFWMPLPERFCRQEICWCFAVGAVLGRHAAARENVAQAVWFGRMSSR